VPAVALVRLTTAGARGDRSRRGSGLSLDTSAWHTWSVRQRSVVFDIGDSLRDARLRRGFDLSDVERETKIRRAHLAALEEERFDALPGEAYARAFLREYAEFLGLDGQLFLDTFSERFGPREAVAFVPLRTVQPTRRPTVPLVPLVFAMLALLAGLLAWHPGAPNKREPRLERAPRAPSTKVVRARPAPPSHEREPPVVPRLTLAAARGDCWLSVRVGSREGAVLFEGLARQGQRLRFARSRLWIRIGAPWTLDVRLDGALVRRLPQNTGNVLVTQHGLRPL
jgi:cytoskeletal protein RodZ